MFFRHHNHQTYQAFFVCLFLKHRLQIKLMSGRGFGPCDELALDFKSGVELGHARPFLRYFGCVFGCVLKCPTSPHNSVSGPMRLHFPL